MINLKQATQLPDPSVIMPDSTENASNDFKTISLVPGEGRKPGTALVRVGAAVTTEELRRWMMNAEKWTLPSDVILGEYVEKCLTSPKAC